MSALLEGIRVLDFGRYIAGPYCAVPLSMSVTEGGIRHRAPLLGEHTDRILGDLGYDRASVAGLRERGIV